MTIRPRDAANRRRSCIAAGIRAPKGHICPRPEAALVEEPLADRLDARQRVWRAERSAEVRVPGCPGPLFRDRRFACSGDVAPAQRGVEVAAFACPQQEGRQLLRPALFDLRRSLGPLAAKERRPAAVRLCVPTHGRLFLQRRDVSPDIVPIESSNKLLEEPAVIAEAAVRLREVLLLSTIPLSPKICCALTIIAAWAAFHLSLFAFGIFPLQDIHCPVPTLRFAESTKMPLMTPDARGLRTIASSHLFTISSYDRSKMRQVWLPCFTAQCLPSLPLSHRSSGSFVYRS
eukprot:COSAG04_NODE_6811_length_1251_cov_1.302083_1_plen_289_part_00